MSLKYFVYIDEFAINSFYNQIGNKLSNRKLTKCVSDKKEMNSSLSANVIKLLEAQVGSDIEETEMFSEEIQYEITMEDKINQLLNNKEIMRTSNMRISEIIDFYIHPHTEYHYICGKGVFNILYFPQEDLVNKYIYLVHPNSVLIFQYGSTENNTAVINGNKWQLQKQIRGWEFFLDHTSKYGVDMCLNGKYIKKEVWNTNIESYKFNVFGILKYCGEKYYCLEPFLIWETDPRFI